MPPLFAFAYSAESKLVHRMHEMASEAEHSKHMAEWTHQHVIKEHKEQLKRMATQKILQQPGMENAMASNKSNGDDESHEREILEKFRESVLSSNIRVVPGNELGLYHKVANFWQENPFKILTVVGSKFAYILRTYIMLSFYLLTDPYLLLLQCDFHLYSSHSRLHLLRTFRPRASSTPNESHAHSCHGAICCNLHALNSHGIQRVHGSKWEVRYRS